MVVSLMKVSARGVSISDMGKPKAVLLGLSSIKCAASPVTVTDSTSDVCASASVTQPSAVTSATPINNLFCTDAPIYSHTADARSRTRQEDSTTGVVTISRLIFLLCNKTFIALHNTVKHDTGL